jgi:hypothetical protein
MNWLTARMMELPSFTDLHEGALSLGRSNLRRLPLKYVIDALDGIGVEANFDRIAGDLSAAHLYTEDRSSAAQRAENAQVGRWASPSDEKPFLFTTALNDGEGPVLYLPDSDTDEQDVQFFADGENGSIERLTFLGDIVAGSAHLNRVNRSRFAGPCLDGPCSERTWGEGCGEGCTCQKFRDVELRASERLRRSVRFYAGTRAMQIAVFRCSPDN